MAQEGTPEETDTIVVTGVRESPERTGEQEGVNAGPGVDRRRRHRQAARQQRGRGAATRHGRAGLEPRRRRGRRHHDSRPPGHRNHLERSQRIHSNGRQLELRDIPANLVGQIDVFKTRAADQIETGLAGQIDVRTRRPFDFDGFALSVSARGNYQEQRESFDPNASVLISNQWDSGDSRFGAMLNVNYASTRWRDQSVTAGAMVPFATSTNPPLGYGAAADNCTIPPNNPNWIPIERFFPDDCRGTPLGGPLQLIWQPGLDRGLSQEPGATLNIAGVDYEYLLARDALFAVDAKGNRERPPRPSRCSSLPMTRRNTPSRPSTRVTGKTFSTTCTSPLPIGGVASARSRFDHHDVPGHQHHQDAHRGLPVRLQQRRLPRAEHRQLCLCAERQVGDR